MPSHTPIGHKPHSIAVATQHQLAWWNHTTTKTPMFKFFKSSKPQVPAPRPLSAVESSPYPISDKPLPAIPPRRHNTTNTAITHQQTNAFLEPMYIRQADNRSASNLEPPEKPFASHRVNKSHSNIAQPQLSAPSDLTIHASTQSGAEEEDVLQLGIKHHEEGNLALATTYFEKSARMNNPNGLLLYGMALRHGWGCEPDPVIAFQYLQKAAESAVVDLNALQPPTAGKAGTRANTSNAVAAKSELVLAIYELGVCFRHGWGVPKNKVTAAYYFEIAANLGDMDAQNDLAFCFHHGEGVKKDLKKAAKYYRMAANQGASVVGNSWIWKTKYDE
jgi:hypothetical protein